MKIAALQLDCDFANVSSNIKKIELYIKQASENGAELILLPEFFTSAIGFSPEMNIAALEGIQVRGSLKDLSAKYDIIVGGSYLLFDGTDSYNNFDLVFPNGEVFTHQKDIPTQFENCYYTSGDKNNILHTPIGEIGVALCWEMIRYDTLKRLSEKADFMLSGSCWWDLPEDAPNEHDALRLYNQNLALETPVTFAKLLHVPVIHANHCGKITSYNFPLNDKLQTRQLVGAAQVIDSDGKVLERKGYKDGEGLIFSDIPLYSIHQAADIDFVRFWIPDLPAPYIKAWNEVNPKACNYYNEHMLPYYKSNYNNHLK